MILGDAARAGRTAQAGEGLHHLLCDSTKEPSIAGSPHQSTTGGPGHLKSPPRHGFSSGTPLHAAQGQTQPCLQEQRRLNESHLCTRSYCTQGAPPGPPALCPQVGTPPKPKHPPQRLKPYCCPTCIQSCPLLSWLIDWSPGGLQTYAVGGFVSSSTSCIASDWCGSLAFSCS